MQVEFVQELARVPAEAWDALVGEDDPFVEHAFLSLLEQSGSVGGRTGWHPRHVLVRHAGRLVGALPLYVKEHGYGEYIFDWAWANAAPRLGLDYYPKLVSMVPLTPATGRRVLLAPGIDRPAVVQALLDGCLSLAERIGASSIHLLFLSEEDRELLRPHHAFLPRLSHQFHWHSRGDRSFEEHLDRFRSSYRKQIRRERRAALESGLRIDFLRGEQIDAETWSRIGALYRDTCARKGSYPYLHPSFFELAPERVGGRARLARACRAGETVAISLGFAKGKHVYGRYWGASIDQELLHFELCFHQFIEHAIEIGAERFEAGAQGSHKLRRGLLPSPVHSAHWIRDPRLRELVGSFLPREAALVAREIEALGERSPFRREEGEP
ncbi:MAG: GNAT family N-acetyltransferase [Myxococcales bacterium]|nr:GNAT family N-acetyltransferase [Myxococcales bacterium]